MHQLLTTLNYIIMNEKETKKAMIGDEELQAVAGGFTWNGVEYNTMADLRNAMAQGIITEEEAIIIGNEIGGTPN